MILLRTTIPLALLATALTGCVDVEDHDATPWETPEIVVVEAGDEAEAEAETEPDVDVDVDDTNDERPPIDQPTPVTYEYVLEIPPRDGCDEGSLVGPADFTNGQRSCSALLEETFGSDGCLDERWTRSCEGSLVADEHYELFDPTAIEPAYFIPMSYYHRWVYDDGGLVVEQTRAHAPDEDPFFRQALTWDDQGRLVSRNQQNDPQFPEWERQFEERWTYHAGGEILEYIHAGVGWQYGYRNEFGAAGELLETWKDDNGAKYLQRRNFWTDGVLTSFETFDAAGPYTTTTLQRDAEGRVLRKIEINDRHGWLDEWDFDDAGRVLNHTQDSNRDGRIDYRVTREWTTDGQEKLHRVEYEFNAAGTPRTVNETRTSYDAQLRPVERHSAAAWHEPTTLRTRWTYDDDGVLTVIDELAPDGTVARNDSTTRTDPRGLVVWSRRDNDRDGTPEWEERNRYDAEDRLIETTQDVDGDGVPEYVRQIAFDRAGQPVRQLVDTDGDRIVDERRELRY